MNIQNVIAISRCPCSAIMGASRVNDAVSGIPSNVLSEIEIRTPAKLSINNKVEGGVTVYSHQLVFRTCENIECRGHWAYVLRLADGKQLLMGSYERPYPVTVSSRTLPDNLSDSQLWEVTVSLTTRLDLPQIA